MALKPQNIDPNILKKYIFEPLSTIIKLAILKNKPVGTKISIKDNNIFIQEIGIFQSLVRYYKGDAKIDIHYLSIPIEIACVKYIKGKYKNNDIVIIFKCAKDGLVNLMSTYKQYPIIIHCLKYYHSIIDSYINNENNENSENNENDKNNEKKVKKKKREKENKENDNNELIIKQYDCELLELYNSNILTKFDDIWSDSRVDIIIDMITYLLNERVPNDYAACIETYMIPIDKEVVNIILNKL